jgi:hypothetical protein
MALLGNLPAVAAAAREARTMARPTPHVQVGGTRVTDGDDARSLDGRTLAWYAGLARSVQPALLDDLGRLAAQGQAVRAAPLFGAGEVLRTAAGYRWPGQQPVDSSRDVAMARAWQSSAACTAAQAAGPALTPDEMMATAVAEEAGDG